MSRTLRIAFLSYRSDPRVGGQGVYLSQAAAALARRGHDVHILSGPPYPYVPDGVKLIQLPSLDLYAQKHGGRLSLRWRHLKSWTDTSEYFGHLTGRFMEPETFGRRVTKYLRAHTQDYDVVLDNQTLAWGLLEIEQAGLPVVGMIHHPTRRDLEIHLASERNPFMRLLRRRWYAFLAMHDYVAPRLRHVVVVSEAAKQDIANYLRIAPARMTAIPLGINRAVFKPHPEITRHPARLVTTASTDVPLKGLTFLIEAYAQILPSHRELELVIVGQLRKGPTQRLLKRRGLLERVRFVHDLSNEDLAALYASATMCVSPSLYEGFGLPAAEAICCGAPVVVTDGGALPEVVGDAGVIVPKGDATALGEAISRLLNNPTELDAMAARSVARASFFDWDRLGAAYERVLLDAIGASDAPQQTQALHDADLLKSS